MNPCTFCAGTTSLHDAKCPTKKAGRVYYPDVSEIEAQLAARARDHRHHDVICLILKEMVRARYDHSHHSPDVIAKNVTVARAYADKVYPLEGK